MMAGRPAVTTASLRLLPDPTRVVTKPFLPGEETFSDGRSRVKVTLERILGIPEAEVQPLLAGLLDDFGGRHRDFEDVLECSFVRVAHHLDEGQVPSADRRLLIGAYFTHEFSIQAAAFFNPSVVPAPDQSGVPTGDLRFVMSARSVGEGHLSSIELRTGVLNAAGHVTIDPVTPYASTGRRKPPVYDKRSFVSKLAEMDADKTAVSRMLNPLPDAFSYDQLVASIDRQKRQRLRGSAETIRLIHWLASSNYIVAFDRESELTERVLFPSGPNESRGMEDARFVRLVDDDGSVMYYATYTAFDGTSVLPQSIETRDFLSFRIATLSGSCVSNKGMALFPRRMNGRYAMLARLDGENLYFMMSDTIRHWDAAEKVEMPTPPWALIQRGNCGSPIETADGWLVVTHGVGPMRRYSIGAMLLDLDDPRRVIAHLPEPILTPEKDLRDGHVPNVVYSCGSLVHEDRLMLPYGFSDVGIAFATLSLSHVLEALGEHRV
jgi:predicted GH43/DUF377 family glycosyl hydrolase